jgi:tryptophan-rich sensory protein
MRLISEQGGQKLSVGRLAPFAATGAAVSVAAVASGLAVDAGSTWYGSLRKPVWQPPPWAFGAVWTPLYATIAYAGGRALGGSRKRRERVRLAASLAVNLTLNAGWSRLFFRLHSPKAGLAGTLLLDLSNVELVHRTAQTDRTAAKVLLPYAAWCLFATALNGAIARQSHGAMPASKRGRG